MSTSQSLLEDLVGLRDNEQGPSTVTKTRAFAWARVSTDMQKERGLSIPEQLREIRCYAEKHEIEIVDEFSEAASAFQREEKRTKFRHMIAEAKADKEVSVILVHDFSRFSRDSLRAKSLIRELRKSGVRVISLNDPEIDPESVAGVYMEAITFAKNEAYSREIAFHTRKGCRANVRTRDEETGWCYKNGGQPLWGYRSERLIRGNERNGRPIYKSIWLPDDTVVADKPVHELAAHCLKMAAGGASLDELRDFCNDNGIPARRGRYWSTSTWNSLLEPYALMKYCGFEVWNVHRKNGSKRPSSEWVIVEDAHPALITPELARAVVAARRRNKKKCFDTGYGRSRSSPYLLSGGLFKCTRCGSNMTGKSTGDARYYVCGSQPYRRGRGCGPGVYVPKEQVEDEVLEGLGKLLGVCSDPKGFTRRVNEELRKLWELKTGFDPGAEQKIKDINKKIANIHTAIEDGLADASWANARLRQLTAERDAASASSSVSGAQPQLDTAGALAYRRDLKKTLTQGTPAERKKLIRSGVLEMQLAPERLEVEITYQIPEPVVHGLVAGAGFEPATSGL